MTEPVSITPPGRLRAVRRGARGWCPHCGAGRIFKSWYTAQDRCPACGLHFEPAGGATFAFTYVGSAGVTGLLVILMFIVIRPTSPIMQTAVFLAMIALLIGTMPQRKGAIIALDYLIRRDLEGEMMPPCRPGGGD